MEAGNSYGNFRVGCQFRGSAVASYLPASVLSTTFGIVVIIGAVRTYKTPAAKETEEISTRKLSYIFAGILIGFFPGFSE